MMFLDIIISIEKPWCVFFVRGKQTAPRRVAPSPRAEASSPSRRQPQRPARAAPDAAEAAAGGPCGVTSSFYLTTPPRPEGPRFFYFRYFYTPECPIFDHLHPHFVIFFCFTPPFSPPSPLFFYTPPARHGLMEGTPPRLQRRPNGAPAAGGGLPGSTSSASIAPPAAAERGLYLSRARGWRIFNTGNVSPPPPASSSPRSPASTNPQRVHIAKAVVRGPRHQSAPTNFPEERRGRR
jgi:hypothetical protein